MFPRRLRISPTDKEILVHRLDRKDNRSPTYNISSNNAILLKTCLPLLVLSSWLLLLSLSSHPFPFFLHHHRGEPDSSAAPAEHSQLPPPPPKCQLGGYFYIHQLPEEFNADLVRQCKNLSGYTDMCPHVANGGLGQPMSRPGWYRTHQFLAEMIFHARAERHPCRTYDPESATLFYVPYYGGLHASKMLSHPNITVRDRSPRLLEIYILQHFLGNGRRRRRNVGADHFLALGRTAWDFMHDDAGPDYGANRLLRLPAILNMSVLVVERNPWHGANQLGIPYPSYFHPASAAELLAWQGRVRRSHRRHLLSIVAGPRSGVEKAAVRGDVFRLCAAASRRCRSVRCASGSSSCHDPDRVMSVMLDSVFCAQPPGDSFTRRSVFDSILAGCIPVFFSPHTAYSQYGWFFPEERSEYSVYVPAAEVAGMVAALGKIPAEKVAGMQEKVVGMIPRITYAHPNATDLGFRDAVDVALERLMAHVRGKAQAHAQA